MRWGAPAVLLCSLTATSVALAETPSLNLRGFEPPMDPQGSLALEPTTTPGHGNFGAGFLTSYAYRLVRVENDDGRQLAVPVRHQLSTDFLFNWGLGQRLALGLALPVVLYQSGKRVPGDDWKPPTTALGDPTVEFKWNLLPKGPLGGIGVAAFGRATLPLASEESGMGNGSVTAQFGLRGELDLVLASVRASAGYVFRSERGVFWGDQFGNYAPWALGVVLKPQALGIDKQGRFQWFLEGRGALAVTPEFATRHSSPVQLAAGTRYALGSDFSGLAALEIPLNGGIGAPSLRAVLGLSWAPRFLDADLDGIQDDADDCPEGMPEDRDGFEDDDGCPEDDNDGDAVSDADDRCPAEAEDLDGHADEDGCPDTDNDGDKILDADDACPNERGVVSRSKKYNGCPRTDTDGDGIYDDVDRCPDRAEDLDGRYDQDGCPDPDDDADGILDAEDDCPTQRGPRRAISGLNGCLDPDVDADTYFGTHGDRFTLDELFGPETNPVGTPRDLCPDQAEDFNGNKDEDGCADADPKKKTAALVTLEVTDGQGLVKFARQPKWAAPSSDALAQTDLVLLRALSKELRAHREWTAAVTVPSKGVTQETVQLAKRRAERIVRQLKRLTLRDNAATVAPDVPVTRPGEQNPATNASVHIVLRTQARRAAGELSPSPTTPPVPGVPQPAPGSPGPSSGAPLPAPGSPGSIPSVMDR
jgi:hypothetical protein